MKFIKYFMISSMKTINPIRRDQVGSPLSRPKFSESEGKKMKVELTRNINSKLRKGKQGEVDQREVETWGIGENYNQAKYLNVKIDDVFHTIPNISLKLVAKVK